MKDEERYEYMIYRADRDVVRVAPKRKKHDANMDTVRAVFPQDPSGDATHCPTLLKMPWGAGWANGIKQSRGLDQFRDRVLDKALDHLRKQMQDGKAAGLPP